MDKAVLVSAELAIGTSILEALDRSDLAISVALWVNLAEYGDWRFTLSSRRLDKAALSKAYGMVRDALHQSGFLLAHTPALMILEMTDPFVKALRQLYRNHKIVEGMRLGSQLIGDRFVEDALVYRIR